METLKQILEKYEAKHTIHGNVFYWTPENLEDILSLVTKWLQQKRKELVVDSDLRCVIYDEVKYQAKLIDELLERVK